MDGVGRKMQNGVARVGRRQTSWSQLDPPHPEPVPTGQALDSLCRMGGCSRGPPRARAHALGRVPLEMPFARVAEATVLRPAPRRPHQELLAQIRTNLSAAFMKGPFPGARGPSCFE